MADADIQEAGDETDRQRSAWMLAAQAGDRMAYEALLRDCVPVIQHVARRRGVQPDRIDDVVQEVLLTVHRARQTYDPTRSFTAWLSTIATRRAIDALRRRGRQDHREVHGPVAYANHPDPAAGPALRLEQKDRAVLLGTAIAGLPSGQREAVEQLGLQERSLAEAAAVTGRSKGALKVNLHRALKTLRARLSGEAEWSGKS
jgi:RNA polymerase sigma-70 factor (ECF subfamily)